MGENLNPLPGRPTLPPGWRWDPDAQSIPERGVWYVIQADGNRLAWTDPRWDEQHMIPCPHCLGVAGRRCSLCSGVGRVDGVPYCDRPWDEVLHNLWLGGIHCQYTGAPDGNCYPEDVFDLVIDLTGNPDFRPNPGVEFVEYPFPDAPLDALHHAELEDLARLARTASQERGRKTLVRCQAGMNRSALVVGLAMIQLGWPSGVAIEWMRSVRSPFVLFNPSFREYLRSRDDKRGHSMLSHVVVGGFGVPAPGCPGCHDEGGSSDLS